MHRRLLFQEAENDEAKKNLLILNGVSKEKENVRKTFMERTKC